MNRRHLCAGSVAALAALAGGASGCASTSAGPHNHGRATRRIDVHHHIIPPAYLEEAPETSAPQRIWQWSPQRTLDEMARNGVESSMLSFSTPSYWHSGLEAGRRLARLCNDYSAQLSNDNRGRFGLFAGVPPLSDVEGCLAEIAYACDALHADGVTLMTNYSGQYLGDDVFVPVLEELNRRAAIVFVHPADPTCCASYDVPMGFAEWPFDTARTILSLWTNGAEQRWPRIKFIFSHGGGALPMIADRVDKFGRPAPRVDGAQTARLHDALSFFRTLYFDTANAANPPALAATRLIAQPDRILFGSDFPYIPIARTADNLMRAPLSAGELIAIERGNAIALMPRLSQS